MGEAMKVRTKFYVTEEQFLELMADEYDAATQDFPNTAEGHDPLSALGEEDGEGVVHAVPWAKSTRRSMS